MPTSDPSNVLFQIAHPDLYERNPFNVLNLPVAATAKDVRRRKEDIEAAFDAGTESEEFRNMLPGDDDRKMPTRAEVEQLFSVLEDPEKRIAYSLFWFWPDSSETPGGGRRRSNPNGEFGHSSVIAKWEEKARGSSAASSSPTVAKHNLAVFHHMMGLAYELALRKYDIKTADTPADVPQHWKAAIYWWNDVSGQADFWHAVSENVSALDDPRLDYRFVRALRDQFAFAFDQINVELAIDFAKRGREADARRQVEYMKLSQPESDDVEGTFDDAFAGLLRQTEAIVKTARSESEKNPNDGLKKAYEILSRTDEPLRVSRIVLEQGTPIRNAICTTIVGGVRSCLIGYGNNTKDWDSCLSLAKQLKNIAETDEQRHIVDEDERIIKKNSESNNLARTCWLCSKRQFNNTETVTVPLFGKLSVNDDKKSVEYNTRQLAIPVCRECLKKYRLPSGCSYQNIPDVVTHPFVDAALDSGWRIGQNITNEAVCDCIRELLLRKYLESKSFSRFAGFGDFELHDRLRHYGGEDDKPNDATIIAFHNWCRVFEQVFPFVDRISRPSKQHIAERLFKTWGCSLDDCAQIYEKLFHVWVYDGKHVVSRDDGVHVRSRGGWPYYQEDHTIPPVPLHKTFIAGSSFLKSLFYESNLIFDVGRAHFELGARCKSLPFISVDRIKGEGYEKGPQSIRLKTHTECSHWLGFVKSKGDIFLDIDLSSLNPFGKSVSKVPCVVFSCYEKLPSGTSDKHPCDILRTCVNVLYARNGKDCFAPTKLLGYGSTSEKLSRIATLLKSFSDLLLNEFERHGYYVYPNGPYPEWNYTGWSESKVNMSN